MVSVVILSFNRCAEVLKTVQIMKALKQDLPYELEIIVVDNASKDGSAASLRSQHADIVVIDRKVNNGIAGWNDGFAVARYKYLLVLDDDSHVHSGLEAAVQRMETNPQIGILGFETTDEQLRRDIYLNPEDAWKDGQAVPGFIGCGALIRKAVYERIGGFAEWLFVYTHEFEYAIRCLDAGYGVSFFAQGYVVHRASTINRTNKRLRIFATRNEMAIVYKYFGSNRLKYLYRVVINNLKFIKREGFKSGLYILQGVIQFLKLKNQLNYTPVSLDVQNFFASSFWATKPVMEQVKKRFIS